MTVAHSPIPDDHDRAPQGDVEIAHRARFSASQLTPTTVLVSVTGDVDASNALELIRYAERHAPASGELVLDLSGLTFFGTQGFSALHNINVNCSRFAVNWVLVPSSDVHRLLRVCDPAGGLPVAESIELAEAVLKHGPRSHLTVVLTAE